MLELIFTCFAELRETNMPKEINKYGRFILLVDRVRPCMDLNEPSWKHRTLITNLSEVLSQKDKYVKLYPEHEYTVYEIKEIMS